MTSLTIPVSAGELMDKITILRVKAERIGAEKRVNVAKELELLEAVAASGLTPDVQAAIAPLVADLMSVNAALWDVEDAKRECERLQTFGAEFVKLARRVYIENDRRAAIKRRINETAGSDLIEEKSYAPY